MQQHAQQQAQAQAPLQAQQAQAQQAWAPPGFQYPSGAPSSWDQQSLASSFSTMSLQ